MFKRIGFTIALLLICSNAWAASLYFIGETDSHTNDVNNWATSSGGTTHPAAIPGASDTAYFDGNSPSALVDAAWSVGSVDCTGYTNTLTLGANLTVYGNLTFVAGMTFTPSTYMVQFKGNTAFSIATGGKQFYDLRFSEHSTGANSTYTLSDDITVTHDFDIYRAYKASTCKATINGNNIYIGRNFTTSASMGCDGTTVLQFNGTGAQTWTGSNAYGNSTNNQVGNPIIVNKDSNTLTFSGTIYTKDSSFTFTKGDCDFGTSKVRFAGTGITYTAGALTIGTSTLEFGSTQTIPSGFLTATGNLYKLSITEVDITGASPTITLGGDITVSNTFVTARVAGASSPNVVLNGNKLYLQNNITMGANMTTSGTTVWEVSSNQAQTITDSGNGFQNDIIFNKSGDTVTFSGTVKYKTGTMTYTAGTVDAGTSTLSINGSCTLNTNGISWYNITHSATNTTTFSSDLTLTNTLAINANTIYSGAYNVHAQGAITRDSTARTLTSANTTLLIDGGANQSIGTTNGMNFLLPVTVNKSGNTATMAAEIDFGNGTNTPTFTLTSAQSTLAWGTSLLKCIANANLNCGTVYQLQVSTAGTTTLTGNLTATSTVTIDASRTLNIQANTLTLQGDCVNNGTLTASSGTVALTGSTAKQSFTGNNITFGTFQCITPTVNKEICFLSGKTYTFNTALTLISAYGGNSLTLSASTPDTVTNFNIDAGCTQTIERVIVLDNDASAGETGHDYKGTISDAQNVNWDDVAPSTPSPTAYAWIG